LQTERPSIASCWACWATCRKSPGSEFSDIWRHGSLMIFDVSFFFDWIAHHLISFIYMFGLFHHPRIFCVRISLSEIF
jgi:hypothetical protein